MIAFCISTFIYLLFYDLFALIYFLFAVYIYIYYNKDGYLNKLLELFLLFVNNRLLIKF